VTSQAGRRIAVALTIVLAWGAFLVIQTITNRLTHNQQPLAVVLATTMVSLLFLPLQTSIGWLISRFVGDDPAAAHRLLAELIELPDDASDLTGIERAVKNRIDAPSCRLTVTSDTETLEDDDVVIQIRQGVDVIGTIAMDRAADADVQRRRMLEDMATSLSAILMVNRRHTELERNHRAGQAKAEEVGSARRKVVREMDKERRRIERNLHDGAQTRLTSLGSNLGVIEDEIVRGRLEQSREMLDQLFSKIDNVEMALSETATGKSSVVLTEHGLTAALEELRGAQPPAEVDIPEDLSSRRFPQKIEEAIYYCCTESVNNSHKHAPGASVKVRLDEADGVLRFTIQDNGPGLSDHAPDANSGGRGLRNMRARISSVEGTIDFRPDLDIGTTVKGTVPLPRQQELLDQLHELGRRALQLDNDGAASEQLQNLQVLLGYLPTTLVSLAAFRLVNEVFWALDTLTRSCALDGDKAVNLRHDLEKICSGNHELAEIDLLNELQSDNPPLGRSECDSAQRLLGADGIEPRARLGLADDSSTSEMRETAEQQLVRWQRRAFHPASTRAVQDAAEVLVRTCQRLLSHVRTG
jgi:signal transduction histidine kinase